ncbi:TonB-dependent receptor [Colwelliaceae bacterium BS250]
MFNFKPNKLTIALLSSGLMSMSSVALAAEEAIVDAQAEQEIEVIEVTGIRRSLAASQALKMTNSSIVEAVSAEDIGKLPDVSIAESIARLPGVAAQRLNGRANVISIRGLSPDFTTATLNGREQASTSDNRAVEFDQYPSELLSGVVVYKTPDASLISQAIGGTIDMQTIRPLSHGKQTFSIGARYEENDLGALNSGTEDTGHRLSFSYIDQFANDTIGIAIGIADMTSPNQEERWEAWGYDGGPVAGAEVLGGAKPYVRSAELARTGVMAVIEFQPTDDFNTSFDLYYSEFEEEQVLRGIELPLSWGGAALVNPTVENGLVTSGTYEGVKAIVRNDYTRRDSEVVALGWNTEYLYSSNLTLMADVSYSKAEREDFSLESYATNGRGDDNGMRDSIDFVMDGTTGATFTPTLDYSDTDQFKLGAARTWGNGVDTPGDGQDGFINAPEIEDELSAIRLGAEYSFDSGVISSIEAGFNYSEREKSKADTGIYLTLKDYPELTDIPEEFLKSPTSLDFIGMGDMVSYDSYGLYKSGAYNEFEQRQSTKFVNSWTVKEEVATVYVQANLDMEVADLPLSGNFGLQVVNTDQSSTGSANYSSSDPADSNCINGFCVQPTSESYDYTEVLPSINLSLEVAENQILRFGAARTLARARMDQMNASAGTNYDPSKADNTDLQQSPWSGNGGNVQLDPWMANQLDLSYEFYMDDKGYFSVAGFYKELENYVYDEQVLYDFSDIPVEGQQPALNEGYITAPANGEGGDISGIEATFSLSGALLADALSGFGVIVSGSITESEVQETKGSDTIDLPGLSKKVLSTTLYFEDYGFSARVSSRYRSEFLGETNSFTFERVNRYVAQELIVDAQIGYDFSQSDIKSLDGLSVLLQVSNLTDEPFTTYENDASKPKDHQIYGRNFMLGMNYTF